MKTYEKACEDIAQLQINLGYHFKNPSLLLLALLHPSLQPHNSNYLASFFTKIQAKTSIKHPILHDRIENYSISQSFIDTTQAKLNNQRLEFLGDSALNLAMAELIYTRFPEMNEGQLSLILANLVNRQQLSDIAAKIGIGDHLIMDKGEEISGGRHSISNLENALEAIVGAIFCDSGYASVQKFVSHFWNNLLEKPMEILKNKDYKSQLQEYAQKNGFHIPNYSTIEMKGPPHAPIFMILVELIEVNSEKEIKNGKITYISAKKSLLKATGMGKTKKLAEQQAAQNLLENL
jgi:ribonuclease-3